MTGRKRLCSSAQRQSALPHASRSELQEATHSDYLRSLINALEPVFRFRHGLNRRNPEIACGGRFDMDSRSLPFVEQPSNPRLVRRRPSARGIVCHPFENSGQEWTAPGN